MNLAAIVLAAGASSRMGRAKALLPWQDSTLLAHEIEVLRDVGVERIAVVIGMHAQQIRRAVPVPMPFVFNPRWAQGRSTSLAAGARMLRREPRPDAIVVQNVDQPTTSEVIRRLVEALETSGADAAQPVYRDAEGVEHGGHPVLLSGALLPALVEAREATEGLRGVLAKKRIERVSIDDPTVGLDLDTREAYEAAKAALGA
ncbi:MAG: NTP transferase domain-containing protein [Dehalococcoidia bacterium]